MAAALDQLQIEAVSAGDLKRSIKSFDLFTSFRLRTSLLEPSEATMECGDDGTFDELSEYVRPGAYYKVVLADRPILTGRIEVLEAPVDAGRSAELQFVVRTRMADARFKSCDPKVRVERVTLKDFVLACYAGIGLTEKDFIFNADVSRDLMTGRSTRGGKAPKDLAAIKLDQAKIQPGETIFEAVDRHLRRHGFMHWDGPDGRIVVAAPNDQQEPRYRLRLFRHPDGAMNNLVSARRIQDISEVPSALTVKGYGSGALAARTRVSATVEDSVVLGFGFQRDVLLVDEQIKTKELALRRARQERARRARRLDAWQFVIDRLSYRDGDAEQAFAIDTVADVIVGTAGGAVGAYHVESVELTRSASTADVTTLSAVRQGTWVL